MLTAHQSTIDGKKAETFEDKMQRLETSWEDFNWMMSIVSMLGLPKPDLDVFASEKNKKCDYHLDEQYDSLKNDWLIKGKYTPDANWCQPPFKFWQQVIMQLHNQYQKYRLPIYAFVPSRFEKNPQWGEFIERYRFECAENGFIFYLPLARKFMFLIDGKPSRSKKGQINYSPDGFKLVIWIGDKYLNTVKENIPKFYEWYNTQFKVKPDG